jgi:hypothetical protein
MADAKAPEKADAGDVVSLLNTSKSRSFVVLKDGKSYSHLPGKIATYTAAEAENLKGYKELLDTSKLPGSLNATQLKRENADLLAANKALQAQLDALKPKDEKPAAPAKEDKAKK